MHTSLTRIAAVLIASTMLAGVAQAETVRWARSSDSLTLDPHSQNQGVTHTFAHHIYETLMW
ncbi:MAG: ABC transporter substrate-binding protein, partial [Rhodospirillaceae bacterium]